MPNLRRSLVITFFSSTGATAVQFIVSLILARMLSPSEIGVYSMTIVFVNIAHIFRDFGISAYIQREPDLTPEKIAAASGVLFLTSWTTAALLFFGSHWLAAWFAEPSMQSVMEVLAIGFIFIPLGTVTIGLLTREFAADKQAYIIAAGNIAYAITCLGLAHLGFGTMSLAWANLANILVSGLACIPLRPRGTPWMPSLRNWNGVVQYGVGSLLANSLNAINNAIPDILLGKLGNARMVGLFSRAGSTVTIFSYIAGTTVNYGTLSYISQANHRGEPLAPLLGRSTTLLTGIGWPALGWTTLLGSEIVLTLYGDKWLESVPAIAGLTIAAAITMLLNYTPLALMAIGRPYLSAVPTAINLGTKILLGIVLFDGTLGTFAWAICIATVAAAPAIIYQQNKYLGYTAMDMCRAAWPSLQVTAICMLACELLRMLLPATLHHMSLLLTLAGPLALVWYAALRLTRHPLVAEVDHMFGKLRGKVLRSS